MINDATFQYVMKCCVHRRHSTSRYFTYRSALQDYIFQGGLSDEYLDMMTEDLASGYTKSPGALASKGVKRRTSEGRDSSHSFSLTLLVHRWDRESQPRIKACLAKRLDNLGMTNRGIWLPNHDMSTKLMELREG